jgi:hypothetical protein
VGDGSKVRFKHDLWCGNMVFKESFPGLFDIACTNMPFLLITCSIKWNVSFVGAAHDWEVNIFASFFRVLYLGKVRLESEDGGLAVVGAFQ